MWTMYHASALPSSRLGLIHLGHVLGRPYEKTGPSSESAKLTQHEKAQRQIPTERRGRFLAPIESTILVPWTKVPCLRKTPARSHPQDCPCHTGASEERIRFDDRREGPWDFLLVPAGFSGSAANNSKTRSLEDDATRCK